MIVTKPIILEKLRDELHAAGIDVPGLVLATENGQNVLRAVNAQGRWVDMPAGAAAVVDAHDGTPPTPPNFGTDAADLADVAIVRQWVSATRTYIGQATPTAADTRAQVERNARAIMALLKREYR
jgi:hypothetical protein